MPSMNYLGLASAILSLTTAAPFGDRAVRVRDGASSVARTVMISLHLLIKGKQLQHILRQPEHPKTFQEWTSSYGRCIQKIWQKHAGRRCSRL